MPAVVMVLGCCLGAVHTVGLHVRVTDAAADAARALARGDDEGRVRAVVGDLIDGASVQPSLRGDYACAEVSSTTTIGGPALAFTVRASSCALAGGL